MWCLWCWVVLVCCIVECECGWWNCVDDVDCDWVIVDVVVVGGCIGGVGGGEWWCGGWVVVVVVGS